ncbi:hypothetical protein Tco_0534923 [Tanacetum coccineum]
MLWLSFPCSNSGKNGNSWVPIPVTTPPESGTSTTTKMIVPATIEEKTCKKNDVKARSILLMVLPNEHQLTFDHASSSESLDSLCNRLQKLVSRLTILGVVTPLEDLNVKLLRSLPSKWDTHVVVWMNKPNFDTMGLDDMYNNLLKSTIMYDEGAAACALRNFDLEVMELENTQNNSLAKLPMLKLGEHQPKVVQSTTTKMTVPVLTIEEKDYVNRNDVKASEVYSS